MKKSKRQAGIMKSGRDAMLSQRFEKKVKRSKARRSLEKAGRKAARKGRK